MDILLLPGTAPTDTKGLYAVVFKNVTVNKSGSPQDVASVQLPAWLTRFSAPYATWAHCVCESAAGTLAGAGWAVYTGPGGTGILFVGPQGPSGAGVMTVGTNTFSTHVGTGAPITLYLQQTTDSANDGVVSLYFYIKPLV